MRTLAHAGFCIALVATSQLVYSQTDGIGFTPLPGQQFSNALSDAELAAELTLNAAPLDLLHPRRTQAMPKAGSVNLFGSVRNNLGASICGLVLANGNFMFSCSPTGSYSFSTGLDANNQVTLFGFAEGHFPYKAILGSTGGRYDITLNVATSVNPPPPPPPPPPSSSSTISFTITDACHDGWAIDWKFFDEDDNLVWPTATTTYYSQYDDTPYTQALSCTTGALICYGARNENPGNHGYWGVDVDNSKSCADCCIRCQSGASLSRALTCS